MDLDLQVELFEQALREIGDNNDLLNQILEVTAEDDETLHILRYALPTSRTL